MDPFFALHITGNPCDGPGRYTVTSFLDSSPYGDAGAWGTQFKDGDSSEAIRLWRIGDMQYALDLLIPESASCQRIDALQSLMATAADLGIRMFIEWLQRHPDPAVREQAIRAITMKNPSAIFEGVR